MSTNQPIDIQLGSSLIVRSDCEKMLEVKTDYKLNLMNMSKPYAMKLIITPYMIAKKKKNTDELFFQCTV